MIALREVKQGEYIKRTNEAKKVYIKAHYNRANKTFTCTDAEDVGRDIFIKADKMVVVEFDY